jgi:multisubunit Na+/H+ antiporter MnhB subunit
MLTRYRTNISNRRSRGRCAALVLLTGLLAPGLAFSQSKPAEASSAPALATAKADDTILLTIFLRHDESKPLSAIDRQLQAQGFFRSFPPPGIEVVSWYVMMGIGQVVTLRVPASRLREVNRAIETSAWGGFRTEFYPTYDYKSEALRFHEEAAPK